MFTPVFIHIFCFIDDPSFQVTFSQLAEYKVTQGLSLGSWNVSGQNFLVHVLFYYYYPFKNLLPNEIIFIHITDKNSKNCLSIQSNDFTFIFALKKVVVNPYIL